MPDDTPLAAQQERSELAEVFVQLADTLVADFDVVEFLQHLCDRCVELLDVDAAGLLLADPGGELQVLAATSESARLVELFQLQAREGPCLDCYRDGAPVVVPDVSTAAGRWPQFTPACVQGGFAAVHAIPMRCREQIIGALNLFGRAPGGLDAATVRVAQSLTDVATIGLLQHRAIHDQHVLTEQLQHALNSRIIMEQAKGVLSERHGRDMEEIFTVLRAHARRHNHRLTDLARAVIDGTDDIPHPAADTA